MNTRAKPPTDHYGIVKSWFRDEQFWLGVAASTVSAGILAAGGLLAALLTRLATPESVLIGFLSFAFVFALAWFGLLLRGGWIAEPDGAEYINMDSRVARKRTMPYRRSRVPALTSGIMSLIFLLGLVLMTTRG